MRELLRDEDSVAEQALALLRNLALSGPAKVALLFDWAGLDLLQALEQKLDPERYALLGQPRSCVCMGGSRIAAGAGAKA